MNEPMRIVSLLPSSTEACFALGLGEHVVGVTHECDFPPEVRGRPILTEPKIDPTAASAEIDRQVNALVADGQSIYRIDEREFAALAPDLVLTQGVCKVCAVSFEEVRDAALRAAPGARVMSLSPTTLAEALDDIEPSTTSSASVERQGSPTAPASWSRAFVTGSIGCALKPRGCRGPECCF
jgi:iron complex transport system substrate-binding protein